MVARGLVPIVLLFLAGCANVEYGRVSYVPIPATQPSVDESTVPAIVAAKQQNAKADAAASGIRYYETAPYLLVFADGKGGIKWKIYYLPDQTQKRTIEPSVFLASITTNHTFSNGMLTGNKVTADTTTLPKAVITAVQGLLTSAAALDQAKPDHVVPPPRLYKIKIDDGKVELLGGAGDVPVQVLPK